VVSQGPDDALANAAAEGTVSQDSQDPSMIRANHGAIMTGRAIGTGASVGNISSGDAGCHNVPSEDDEADAPLERCSAPQRTEGAMKASPWCGTVVAPHEETCMKITGEYWLSNDILICSPMMLVVTRPIGREAWTPVRNARIRTWSRLARSEANSAGSVEAVAISLRAPRRAGGHRSNSRWPFFSTVTASR
jgi:hypothetical protein